MHLDYYIYFQLLSLLIAIICYERLKANSLTAFIFLIYIACVVELCGYTFKQQQQVNYLIFNFYLVFSTPFQLLLFYNMTKPKGMLQKVFITISSLLLLFILINFYFFQGMNAFNTYSLILIMLLNIVLSVWVLIQRFLIDETTTNFFKSPYLWINAVILIFSLGTLVVLGLQQYIQANKIVINNKNVYRQIMPILNVILYSGYSYAFLLCRKTLS
jgi:hypothetical protein